MLSSYQGRYVVNPHNPIILCDDLTISHSIIPAKSAGIQFVCVRRMLVVRVQYRRSYVIRSLRAIHSFLYLCVFFVSH